ncbi:MAG: hypothetical protein GX892_15525 [Thermoanaerobacteraceae bacterium]|nr:hypothetical protein [Thermoanaerobacteraceae bacterium]
MGGKQKKKMHALSTDPIYIGTGGYTIGRVDNTIVRDTITKIPKIPGSSIAGTWRYYMALELQGWFKKNFKAIKNVLDGNEIAVATNDIRELVNRLADKELNDIERTNFNKRAAKFKKYSKMIDLAKNRGCVKNEKSSCDDRQENHNWQLYWGNLISSIKCAGQDDKPNESHEYSLDFQEISDTGHCGHCIICKTFGFSKKNKSQQGVAFFSDLNILLFPVYTRLGVKWITSPYILESAEIEVKFLDSNLNTEEETKSPWEKLKALLEDDTVIIVKGSNKKSNQGYINLGWLNLNAKNENILLGIPELIGEDLWQGISGNLVIVPDSLISQIINSNLEVRTSVSIDPLTGAAKKGALFTSEAIPRGTAFYGDIRLIERQGEDLPSIDDIDKALLDSKKYYECLGIGGMVTRGFGRLKMYLS